MPHARGRCAAAASEGRLFVIGWAGLGFIEFRVYRVSKVYRVCRVCRVHRVYRVL